MVKDTGTNKMRLNYLGWKSDKIERNDLTDCDQPSWEHFLTFEYFLHKKFCFHLFF